MKLNRETQAKGESWEGFEEGWLFFVVLKIKRCVGGGVDVGCESNFNFWRRKGLCTRTPATFLPKAVACSRLRCKAAANGRINIT